MTSASKSPSFLTRFFQSTKQKAGEEGEPQTDRHPHPNRALPKVTNVSGVVHPPRTSPSAKAPNAAARDIPAGDSKRTPRPAPAASIDPAPASIHLPPHHPTSKPPPTIPRAPETESARLAREVWREILEERNRGDRLEGDAHAIEMTIGEMLKEHQLQLELEQSIAKLTEEKTRLAQRLMAEMAEFSTGRWKGFDIRDFIPPGEEDKPHRLAHEVDKQHRALTQEARRVKAHVHQRNLELGKARSDCVALDAKAEKARVDLELLDVEVETKKAQIAQMEGDERMMMEDMDSLRWEREEIAAKLSQFAPVVDQLERLAEFWETERACYNAHKAVIEEYMKDFKEDVAKTQAWLDGVLGALEKDVNARSLEV
ncbi:hypothetical protein M427DRAFT_188370 [Gonapodya prolifera JEL478]|uniref:Uncharacterized protein n=1 Tax=Gonapodya prolifera (strain JEL478) TaxID=1344416 RepID=A0A139A026_GONPJ|nr:hypothetical protein M427DRAFT_188370 [Gonapodya prolifera JEL478]|eukprot:KXS10127.1 hypothetical protein M427DRAFT_188370 [Gonapodya prolifera JEL478]